LFRAAQGEYLRGNWFEAELALNQLLERNPSDADARLMLATLLRRIGQPSEAAENLRRLAKSVGADKWQLEIARQERLLTLPAEDPAQNVQLQDPAEYELPNAA
jgi:cytochrome c-type biogenesis protein CcmH/NrfG